MSEKQVEVQEKCTAIEKPKLFVLVGLPMSGKTTWARQNAPRMCAAIVCPDEVRKAIHGHAYIPSAEPFVWATVRAMVPSLFAAGQPAIIIDACNVSEKRRKEWKSERHELVYVCFKTDYKECTARALKESRLDLIPVIQRMQENLSFPKGENGETIIEV
jgi:predicted kinase